MEKVVTERLTEHMQMNNLQESLQPAYKQLHSTETALLKVQDHILSSLDQGKGAVLLLHDLSAAFDTADHGLLLKTLETTMGIKGPCLQWLTSYLEHRQQSVSIGGRVVNQPHHHLWSATGIRAMPSAVHYLYHPSSGPALDFHLYADDTQLFLEFIVSDHGAYNQPWSDTVSISEVITTLEGCVASVHGWMQARHAQAEWREDQAPDHTPQVCTAMHFPDCCWRYRHPAIRVHAIWGSHLTRLCLFSNM